MPTPLAARVRAGLEKLYTEKYASNATAVAKALGVSAAAISNILSEKNAPSVVLGERIAVELGVSYQQLLGINDDASHEDFIDHRMTDDALGQATAELVQHRNLAVALRRVRVGNLVPPMAQWNVVRAAHYLPDLSVDAWTSLMLAVGAGPHQMADFSDVLEQALAAAQAHVVDSTLS